MDPSEKQISVWICQEEKLVSGLSRRTTCSDVVRVLLEDGRRRRRRQQRRGRRRGAAAGDPPGPGQLRDPRAEAEEAQEEEEEEEKEGEEDALPPGLLCGPPQSYCIVEKWRGFERILPNKTRLLRLWAAWGDERENVRFVLVRSEASLPNAGPRSAEARVVLSRERPGPARPGPARPGPALTPDKQRRVVRKAFRKLAALHRHRRRPPPPPAPPRSSASSSTASSSSTGSSWRRAAGGAPAERMETLVHLVLSQDHTIRQQVQRLRELDREIERYEAKVHLDRVRRHGANYVQDTYLLDAGIELDGPAPGGEPEAAEAVAVAVALGAAPPDGQAQAAALEELARRCDDLWKLQEQRAQQEEVLERLSAEIQEELNRRWMRRRREELAAREEAAPEPDGGLDGELLLERERVRTQLSTSLYIGLRLNTDLEALKADLDYSQQRRDSQERELQGLLQTLHTLELAGAPEGTAGAAGPSRDSRPQPGAEVWVDQARGLAKSCPGNDEDSDTGLSSMHSQDSDSVPVCESLV